MKSILTYIYLFTFGLLPTNTNLLANEAVPQFNIYLDSLSNVVKNLPDDTNKVNLLNELSWNYIPISGDSGLSYGLKALKIADDIAWEKGAADAYNNIGESFRFKGEITSSIENHSNALSIYEELNDTAGQAHTLSQLGMSYFNISNFTKSHEYFNHSLNLSRSMNDNMGIGKNLNYLGNIQHIERI
jgi:tetratricopeptide (TPR) repeat protein